MIRSLIISFLSFLLFISCEKETETIMREVLVRDSLYVNPDSNLIGGVKFKFIYCSEFMTNEDTIIPGTEIHIRLLDTTIVGTMDEEGVIAIDGLKADKFYGGEIYHKGIFYGTIPIGPVGVNIYADQTPDFPIIDLSYTRVKSATHTVEKDTLDRLNVAFQVRLEELDTPFSFLGRGAWVALSKTPSQNKSNADLSYGSVIYFPPATAPRDSLSVTFFYWQFINAGFEIGDSVYYKIYGGSRDKTNSNPVAVSRYPTNILEIEDSHVCINPYYISGSFIWKE